MRPGPRSFGGDGDNKRSFDSGKQEEARVLYVRSVLRRCDGCEQERGHRIHPAIPVGIFIMPLLQNNNLLPACYVRDSDFYVIVLLLRDSAPVPKALSGK